MEIIHNSRTLDYHFRSRHNLDVLNYFKKHIDPVEGELIANIVKVEVKEEPLDVSMSEDTVQTAQVHWLTFECGALFGPFCDKYAILVKNRLL